MPQTTVSGFTCSAPAGGLSFRWSGVDENQAPIEFTSGGGDAGTGFQASTPNLFVPARSLRSGLSAIVGVTACYAGGGLDRRPCGTATTAFTVSSSPLVAALAGANAIVGKDPVTLDCGRGSFDPDAEPGPLAFDWSCEGPNPAGCFMGDLQPLRFTPGSPVQRFTLQSNAEGIAYNITCVVSKSGRSAAAAGFLVARAARLPVVSVDGLPAGTKTNPAARLVLQGAVSSQAPATLAVQWVQAQGPPLNLSDPAVAATPINNPSLDRKSVV